MASVSSGDEERAELLRDGLVDAEDSQPWMKSWCSKTMADLPTILMDLVLSIPFYYVLLFVDWDLNCLWGLLALMIVWRLYRAYCSDPSKDPHREGEPEVPYTCGVVKSNGKTMFLVATIHISPRAPLDVHAVVEGTNPDIAMIELDDERLDRMRDPEDAPKLNRPKDEDLQSIKVSQAGMDDFFVYAQRALWNAERAGDTISGQFDFEQDNPYGLIQKPYQNRSPFLSLVQRGPATEFAPFALKAHTAHRAGSSAVIIMNTDDSLPMKRIGDSASIMADFKVAWKSKSCGFPSIPGLLITKSDGDRLVQALEEGKSVSAELQVRSDSYPRRTFRKRLCQACALIFSGIGILYGIIQCFGIEVGGEFLAAEEAANAKNIPCVCVDSNLNDFWGRLGEALVPHPCNLIDSVLAWLALPRVAFQALFPPRHNIDVFGSMVLHGKSFSLRTWVAFMLAGYVASFVTSHVMQLFTNGAERAAEASGVVKEEDRTTTQTLLLLFLQLYMLPRLYESVAASRDEVMYRSIISKGRQNDSKRMVVVVGAGHSNGILQRARTRGL